MQHVSEHWTLATLRRELAKTQDFIAARQQGRAPKQVGLRAALEREQKLKQIIESKEQSDG